MRLLQEDPLYKIKETLLQVCPHAQCGLVTSSPVCKSVELADRFVEAVLTSCIAMQLAALATGHDRLQPEKATAVAGPNRFRLWLW